MTIVAQFYHFLPAENSAFSDGGGFSVLAPAKRVPTSENDALCKSRDNVRRVVSLLPQALQDLSRATASVTSGAWRARDLSGATGPNGHDT